MVGRMDENAQGVGALPRIGADSLGEDSPGRMFAPGVDAAALVPAPAPGGT